MFRGKKTTSLRNHIDSTPGTRNGEAVGLEPTDNALVERSRRGEREAFDLLVERHAPGLYRLAAMMIGNTTDAQDIVQETLMGAFRGLSRFRGEASVRTWFTQIMVRQVAQHRRRETIRRTKPLHDEHEANRDGGEAESNARMDVAALLARLDPEHRDVIVLREIDGLSYDEIANVLNLPRGTVESRLFRARRAMRVMDTDENSPPAGALGGE